MRNPWLVVLVWGMLLGAGILQAENNSESLDFSHDGWCIASNLLDQGTGPPIVVHVAEVGTIPSTSSVPEIVKNTDGSILLQYRGKTWIVEGQYIRLRDFAPFAWKRRVRVINTSPVPIDIIQVDFHVKPTQNAVTEIWSPPTFRMFRMGDDRILGIAAWSDKDDYFFFDSEDGTVSVIFPSCWRLQPGNEAQIGEVYVWCETSSGQDAFRSVAKHWFEYQGFKSSLVYPEWLRRCVLYEASAGGHIDSRFSDVGGFYAFAHQLPYLHDLGVTTIWLNSVHKHKTPPNPTEGGWNPYDPLDFSEIDPILGGEAGLRYLAEKARELNIHLIGEIVPHGGHSVQAASLKEWWIRNRNGEPTRPWGGYGMDYASPEWQQVMRAAAGKLAEIAQIQGVRVDVADGNGPNWGSPRTHHASFSGIGGALELLRAIADGIAAQGITTPVLIPESIKNRPEYFALPGTAVVGYGMEFTDFLRNHLLADIADPARLNQRIREFLERERGSLPPGALILRTLNNHDTVCAFGRPVFQFGTGLARALYGICVAVPGIPMMYQEEEVGSFQVLQRLNRARQSMPELADADADYTSFSFDPAVFSVLRVKGGECVAICLVNLSPTVVERKVDLPELPGLGKQVILYDAVTQRTVAVRDQKLHWRIPPYGTTLFRVGRPPEKISWEQQFGGGHPYCRASDASVHENQFQSSKAISLRQGEVVVNLLMLSLDGNAMNYTPIPSKTIKKLPPTGDLELNLEFTQQVPVVRLWGVDTWVVMGKTARLEDKYIQRRFAYPKHKNYYWDKSHAWTDDLLYTGVAPTGRLWQSILEPLNPDCPELAFFDKNGEGFLVRVENADKANIVLTDCGDEPHDRTNPRLELRFYGNDPDIQPHIKQFGPGTPWRLTKDNPSPQQTVRLVLKKIHSSPEKILPELETYALPDRPIYSETPPAIRHHNILFFPTPSVICWEKVKTIPGTFSIRLTLRSSERDAQSRELCNAYEVSFDDNLLPLTWETFDTVPLEGNAYFSKAVTPPLIFNDGLHSIQIRTLRPWCALSPKLELVSIENLPH